METKKLPTTSLYFRMFLLYPVFLEQNIRLADAAVHITSLQHYYKNLLYKPISPIKSASKKHETLITMKCEKSPQVCWTDLQKKSNSRSNGKNMRIFYAFFRLTVNFTMKVHQKKIVDHAVLYKMISIIFLLRNIPNV